MISSEHDATPEDGVGRVSVDPASVGPASAHPASVDLVSVDSASVDLVSVDPVEAEFVPPFRLHLLNDGLEVECDGVIEGVVTNTSLASWTVNHRVGLRDFRDVHGRAIRNVEFRATLFPSCIEPGEKASFRFDLAALVLPGNAATFILDIVEDGNCWLQDLGSTPVEIKIRDLRAETEALWIELLREVRAHADPILAPRLELIETVIRLAPAAGRSTIRRLSNLMDDCAAGNPYHPVRPDSVTIARSLRDDGTADPKDKFIRHFAIRSSQAVDERNPESLASVFADFTVHSTDCFRTGGVPLPKNLTGWLGCRALPRSIATSPMTRSMVATLRSDTSVVLNPADDGADLIWHFAKSVMIERNLACSAMPDSALHIVTRPAHNTPRNAGFPAATNFMWRTNERGEDNRFKLDLARDADRLSFAVAIFLEGMENEAQRSFLGTEVRDWLEHPLGESDDALSAIEVMILALCGRTPPPDLLPNDDARVLRREIGWLSLKRTVPATNDIRIIGLYNSPSGLGTNMRMSEQVLHSIGCTLEMVDTGADQVYPAAVSEPLFALSRPVDLFHLNLDDVPALVCRYARADRLNVYRIGFALWETSAMPEEHRVGLELVDEIWAPTEFVAEVYRSAGHPNVHVIGKGIELPQPRPFDLGRLGIGDGTFVFLTAFDLGSWIERKDPVAAVEAFKRAFPRDHDVRLIVKSNGLFDHISDKTNQVARLQALAADDERIILFSELLPFPDYLGLIKAANATVSPHRAEGFGYLPAYSLILGTPVIATDFSGTQDFCSEETSFPVRATVVPLRPGEFFYDAPDATWAMIDVDHLAERMYEVRNDPGEAARRTDRGGDLVNERYSMRAMGARYRERLAALPEV